MECPTNKSRDCFLTEKHSVTRGLSDNCQSHRHTIALGNPYLQPAAVDGRCAPRLQRKLSFSKKVKFLEGDTSLQDGNIKDLRKENEKLQKQLRDLKETQRKAKVREQDHRRTSEEHQSQLDALTMSTLRIAENPFNMRRTRHIEIRHMKVLEWVRAKLISLQYVPSLDNLADFFTKPARRAVFVANRDSILSRVRLPIAITDSKGLMSYDVGGFEQPAGAKPAVSAVVDQLEETSVSSALSVWWNRMWNDE
jgi:hypothetical protein